MEVTCVANFRRHFQMQSFETSSNQNFPIQKNSNKRKPTTSGSPSTLINAILPYMCVSDTLFLIYCSHYMAIVSIVQDLERLSHGDEFGIILTLLAKNLG